MLEAVSLRRCGIIFCFFALSACGPSATEGGFDSANPAARMYAIEQAARQGDRSAIGAILEQLDSDDPAVRMLAISTLERLTGRTYGYRHYDDRFARRDAIARWVAAYNSGEINAPIRSMNSFSPQPSASPVAQPSASQPKADADPG